MKRTFSYLIPALSLIVGLLGFQSNAMADDWDLKTSFSINQPVLIPHHVVLPAGSYVIKRLNTVTPVVQILNESETKVLCHAPNESRFCDESARQARVHISRNAGRSACSEELVLSRPPNSLRVHHG